MTDLAAIVALQELRIGVEMDSAYDPKSSEKLAALDAAIAALHSQAHEREGWVLVPREPTEEMIFAGRDENARVEREATESNEGFQRWGLRVRRVSATYRAMIAAAPTGGSET